MGNFSRKVVILYLGNKMEDVKTGREKIFSLFLLGGENGNEILQTRKSLYGIASEKKKKTLNEITVL